MPTSSRSRPVVELADAVVVGKIGGEPPLDRELTGRELRQTEAEEFVGLVGIHDRVQ